MIDYQTGWVPTVASAGERPRSTRDRFVVSIDPCRPEGQGPSAHAMRTGTNYVSNDITGGLAQPALARRSSRQLGVRAQATFLLRPAGQGGRHAAPLRRPGRLLRRRADRHAREARRQSVVRAGQLPARGGAAGGRGRAARERDALPRLRRRRRRIRVGSRPRGPLHLRVQPRAKRVELYRPGADRPHRRDFMPPGEAERVREWLGAARAHGRLVPRPRAPHPHAQRRTPAGC